jgi:hypothetical protein
MQGLRAYPQCSRLFEIGTEDESVCLKTYSIVARILLKFNIQKKCLISYEVRMNKPELTVHEKCLNSVYTGKGISVATRIQDNDKKHFISEISVEEGKWRFSFCKISADVESKTETFEIPP